MRRPWLAAAALAASLLAAPAWADPSGPRLNLSRPQPALTRAVFASRPDAAARINRTAVERQLSEDGLTGQLGYLCGLHSFPPGSSRDGGPASAFGHQGTFLGAKLSRSFR
jgi:hypothetical protein